MAQLMTAEGMKPTGFCDTTLAAQHRPILEQLCKALKLTVTPTGIRGNIKEDLVAAIYIFNMDVQKALDEAGLRDARMVLSYLLQRTNVEFADMLCNEFNINTSNRFKGPLSMAYLNMVIKTKEVKKPAGFYLFLQGRSGDADSLLGTVSLSVKQKEQKATDAQLALITKGVGSARLSDNNSPPHKMQGRSLKEELEKAEAAEAWGEQFSTTPPATDVDDIYGFDNAFSRSAPPAPNQTQCRSGLYGETSTNHKTVTPDQRTGQGRGVFSASEDAAFSSPPREPVLFPSYGRDHKTWRNRCMELGPLPPWNTTQRQVVTPGWGTALHKVDIQAHNVMQNNALPTWERMEKGKSVAVGTGKLAANSSGRPVFTVPDLYSDDEEEEDEQQEEKETNSDGDQRVIGIVDLLNMEFPE